jgi:protein phosphatase
MIRNNYYVGADNGNVVIVRGLPGSVLGYSIHDVDQLACVQRDGQVGLASPGEGFPDGCRQLQVADLQQTGRDKVKSGLPPGALDDAHRQLDKLAQQDLLPACTTTVPVSTPPSSIPTTPAVPGGAPGSTATPGTSGAPIPASSDARPGTPGPTSAVPAPPTTTSSVPQTPGENCRKAD